MPSRPPALPSIACRLTPNKLASGADLAALGVLVWRLSGNDFETDPQLAAIRKVRNYTYHVSDLQPGRAAMEKGSGMRHCHCGQGDTSWGAVGSGAASFATWFLSCCIRAILLRGHVIPTFCAGCHHLLP